MIGHAPRALDRNSSTAPTKTPNETSLNTRIAISFLPACDHGVPRRPYRQATTPIVCRKFDAVCDFCHKTIDELAEALTGATQ
jgi:hypothetical protein